MSIHHHSHDHEHHYGHHHHGAGSAKHVLLISLVIILCFAAVEAVGGWWSGSLALMSDAGHMFTDSLALGIAAFAAWVAQRPPSAKHSYGLGRAEVVAAWVSSLIVLIVSIAVIVEAIERVRSPRPISGTAVMVIGALGLLVNLFVAWMLSHGEQNLNIRAAMLHVLSDMLGSAAALISGAVIYFTGWVLIDPILSIFICILILISGWQLLRESLSILMEGVPGHLDLTEVGKLMAQVPNVHSIHDLHIWTVSSGVVMLSAHIQIKVMVEWEITLASLRKLLLDRYNIDHVTLQPEINVQVIHHMPYKNPGQHQ